MTFSVWPSAKSVRSSRLGSGLLVLAVLGLRARRPRADLIVWLIASAIAISIGFRFILHYFLQILPPLVLVAAPVFSAPVARSWSALRGWTRFAFVALAAAATYSYVTVVFPERFHTLPNVDGIVAEVRARTEPGDKIFVWGQAPEIYWLSERNPATRYPHVGFITGITPKRTLVPAYAQAQPGAADNLLADLVANPPAVIVDAAIASVRHGDRYPLDETSPIFEFVSAGYCETVVVDGMRLLEPC